MKNFFYIAVYFCCACALFAGESVLFKIETTKPAVSERSYVITSIPAYYTDPKEITESRYHHIVALLDGLARPCGLKPGKFGEADYEILYFYTSTPNRKGGWDHELDLRMNPTSMGKE